METEKYPGYDEIPMVEISGKDLLKARYYKQSKQEKNDAPVNPILVNEPSQIINLVIETSDGFSKRVPLKYNKSLKDFNYSIEGIDLKAGYELEFEECDENNTVLNTRADFDSSGYSKIRIEKDGTYFVYYCPNPEDGRFYKIDVLPVLDLQFDDEEATNEIFAEHKDDDVVDMEESENEN